MKITESNKHYRILPESADEARKLKNYLMGWKQRKNDPFIIVENNFINQIALGLCIDQKLYHTSDDVVVVDERLIQYQVEDVCKMLKLKHCLNANPMGLGKTVEAITVLRESAAHNAVIVVPKIIRQQWVDQLKRWWGIEAEIFEKQKILDPNKVYVINYDKLRNESILILFKRFRWDWVVLDEAHKIKNKDSKQTQAVKQIPCARKMELTGTPILRYVDDLWSLLHFFGPEYSGTSYWAFAEYCCEIERTPWGNKIVGTTNNVRHQTVLHLLLKQLMIRRDSVEVAYGKTVESVRLPMTKKQRDLYRKEKQLLLDELPENCTISNGAVLTTRLRQTTSWPGLFIDGEVGPKFEWILEQCINNPEEKLVVFSVFERTASALKAFLSSKDIKAVTVTGKHKAQQNQLSKKTFVEDDAQVLIGTIGAMGQGYDELQYVSKTVIFIDRDWSPEIMKQAEDRLHRMGQKHLVRVYYLECQGSFDQYVGRINLNKSEGIRSALISE